MFTDRDQEAIEHMAADLTRLLALLPRPESPRRNDRL